MDTEHFCPRCEAPVEITPEEIENNTTVQCHRCGLRYKLEENDEDEDGWD